jgi:hypothetical protein
MGMKLDGWRMIGIVLSIIWFVGFAAWGWNDSIEEMRHNFASGLNNCYRDESLRPSDADWAQFKQCLDKEKVSFGRQFESNKRAIPILLAIDLLVIIFAWLIAWTIVRLVQWVKGAPGAK